MNYNEFKYLYPPRPQFKIPPEELDKYDNGEYFASPKLNGTACVVFTNGEQLEVYKDRKSTRLNSSHSQQSRMPSSA